MTDIVERLVTILGEAGAERYGDERVSQLQHALQCATLAEKANTSAALVAAALLHDIGHLIDMKAEGAERRGIDRRHERIGSGYLTPWYPEAITEPVRLHVDAKRYLCAVESGYFQGLSPASKRSLELQGGPFSTAKADAFIQGRHGRQAVDLRRWDDQAKDTDAETPPRLSTSVPISSAACARRCSRPTTDPRPLIEPGRLLLVVGPSGAGKDTLIAAARRQLTPSPGVVFVRRYITRAADAGGEAHITVSVSDFTALAGRGALPCIGRPTACTTAFQRRSKPT